MSALAYPSYGADRQGRRVRPARWRLLLRGAFRNSGSRTAMQGVQLGQGPAGRGRRGGGGYCAGGELRPAVGALQSRAVGLEQLHQRQSFAMQRLWGLTATGAQDQLRRSSAGKP